jgi:hypothetical protein
MITALGSSLSVHRSVNGLLFFKSDYHQSYYTKVIILVLPQYAPPFAKTVPALSYSWQSIIKVREHPNEVKTSVIGTVIGLAAGTC